MPGIVLGSAASKSLTEGLKNVLRDHLRKMGESGLMRWDGNTKAFKRGAPELLAFPYSPWPTRFRVSGCTAGSFFLQWCPKEVTCFKEGATVIDQASQS